MRFQIYHRFFHISSFAALTVFACLACIAETSVRADEFQISLGQGSVITVEVTNETIKWTNVLENGDMNKTDIPFSKIKQLVLSQAPASKQVANIRRLLNLLESDDYLNREVAEQELSDPNTGGRFRSLIKIQDRHENFEVRYRVQRILERLDESSQESSSEFDQLTLKDGTILEGDAGEFVLVSNYRGNDSRFKRANIRLINAPVKPTESKTANATTSVKMFHKHQEEDSEGNPTTKYFYNPEQVLVDFEYAPNGAELVRSTSVNDVFIPFGLKLGTEQVGYVGISGYPFKFKPKPVSGKSICVFETVGSYAKRFKGVTEINFCMPNQSAVPAGVHEIGMFIARVNHSRDFILEAYNADNELLASVESTDEPCIFSGVKSNEPITKVRILSNPYLFRVDRIIDEDYGIDSICFSPPVPVSNPTELEQGSFRLKNGDLLKGTDIAVEGDGFSINLGDGESLTISFDELKTVRFNTELESKFSKGKKKDTDKENNTEDEDKATTNETNYSWMAVLKDRSTIRIEPGAKLTSTTFKNLSFKPTEVLAIKSSQNPTRHPEAGDFERAGNVIVFPTCRIASNNLKFTDQGFSWDKDDLKIEQPIHTGEDEDEEDDPTPPFQEIKYETSGPDSSPTVWINPPTNRAPGTGRLRLTDGQQLTLGGETGFKIDKVMKSSVSISVDGNSVEIPLTKILSIEFPSK